MRGRLTREAPWLSARSFSHHQIPLLFVDPPCWRELTVSSMLRFLFSKVSYPTMSSRSAHRCYLNVVVHSYASGMTISVAALTLSSTINVR